MNKVGMMSAKDKKKGALVPRLRFPEFRDAREWARKKVQQFAKIYKGKGISKSDISSDGKQLCIRYGELYTSYSEVILDVISKTSLTADDLFLSKTNDVIIPASGETKIDIATSSCVMKDDVALGGDLNVIRSCQNGIFLSYYFNGNLKEEIAKKAQGDTVVHLYPAQIGQLDIAIPSKNEQQRIADCLSSLDARITAETSKLDALKAHKNGLLKQLFPAEGETLPQLRCPEFRDAGEWGINLLGQISENLDNRRIPITENVRIRGAIPYYGASGIVDYVNDFIFDEYLLCVSEDGANLIARTSPIAFSISGKSWINNHAHVLKFYFPSRQKLVENYINFIKIDEFLTGMAQPKLNKAKLEVIPIPIPPTEKEEQKIVDCLSSLDQLISAQAQKIDLLKTHKKGLMQQLFPVLDEAKA